MFNFNTMKFISAIFKKQFHLSFPFYLTFFVSDTVKHAYHADSKFKSPMNNLTQFVIYNSLIIIHFKGGKENEFAVSMNSL